MQEQGTRNYEPGTRNQEPVHSISTHDIKQYQYTVSVHSISTQCKYTVSVHSISAQY
jgi:hypothetical protein